jgi:hypothetical protein
MQGSEGPTPYAFIQGASQRGQELLDMEAEDTTPLKAGTK